MTKLNDNELETKYKDNIAKFCVDYPAVSWALLALVFIWGFYAYQQMPKSKDPNIPVRMALVSTTWPGHDATEVEELITRPVEQQIAQSSFLNQPNNRSFAMQSLTLPGVSMVRVQLAPGTNRDVAFNEISLGLNSINDTLPQGAGPIKLNSGFGDTAAVMLAVSSPKADAVEIDLRAKEIRIAIDKLRATKASSASRATVIVAAPFDIDPGIMNTGFRLFGEWLAKQGLGEDVEPLRGPGFIGMDFETTATDTAILAGTADFLQQRLGARRFYPDAWKPAVIRNTDAIATQLTQVAGAKYSYRQLDDFSSSISANLQTIPQVSRVLRSGVLNEQIDLSYSQELLASYGVLPSRISQVLAENNTTIPGGVLQVDDMNVVLSPTGNFQNVKQIGDVIITRTADGTPVYLRNLVELRRGYQSPPQLLSFYTSRDSDGAWQRHRTISLAVQMHTGEQIGELGAAVEETLTQVRINLPDDLIIERVSDQPTQVAENIDLFMEALYEAIALVVIIALIGFWEWRSALLLMISIPITLAMTFGFISILGIDLQQVSIAALIIALGLLVDDPVVAGDAIKREMGNGHSRAIASWLGPTLLAKAIFFATVTNVVAYLPFLLLSGNQGDFLYSLPIVMACALISSRITSMTFVPFLADIILRENKRPVKSLEELRTTGFTGRYYRVVGYAIDHRGKVLLFALVLLICGASLKSQLKNSFFPDDVQYLSTVDVWLKNDASIEATNDVTIVVEQKIRAALRTYAQQHSLKDENALLNSITTTIGGGAPRFWFTITPEQRQNNYAQLIVPLKDKDLTPLVAPYLQEQLSSQIVGADIDVKQLQTTPVNYPVAIRIGERLSSGSDSENINIRQLQDYAHQIEAIIQQSPAARTVRNDWGDSSLIMSLNIDEGRANLAGITDEDIAASTSAGINGSKVGTLREGDKQIPIVSRLRLDQRARLSDLNSLYVVSVNSDVKVPLMGVASTELKFATQRISRLEQFRTITVYSYPHAGFLSDDIMKDIQPELDSFAASLPAGYTMAISGNQANQQHGFGQLLVIMAISAGAIFMALVFQFRNLVKPLLVFAAVPFGMVGALAALYIMDAPFGFMSFLGIVSLIGVIVSHIIVLFDFIEERHEAGDPLREALLDAGIMRLRPILITIAATTLALVPLAIHGGPLWQGLCYAQIGGLFVATFGTLILVPTLYAFVVLDLKAIKWETRTA